MKRHDPADHPAQKSTHPEKELLIGALSHYRRRVEQSTHGAYRLAFRPNIPTSIWIGLFMGGVSVAEATLRLDPERSRSFEDDVSRLQGLMVWVFELIGIDSRASAVGSCSQCGGPAEIVREQLQTGVNMLLRVFVRCQNCSKSSKPPAYISNLEDLGTAEDFAISRWDERND